MFNSDCFRKFLFNFVALLQRLGSGLGLGVYESFRLVDFKILQADLGPLAGAVSISCISLFPGFRKLMEMNCHAIRHGY